MTDSLTLSAQAVIDAYDRAPVDNKRSVAAVLRAVADQVVPENIRECETYTNEAIRLNLQEKRHRILAIAAELEAK